MHANSLREVVGGLSAKDAAATVASHEARYAAPGSTSDAQGAAHYYDLVTDFYEYGWGQSFHFAPRGQGERLDASIARLEHLVAARLGLRPGMKVLDAGCGVGGPMRSIARFSGASVEGVTINAYQVEKAQGHNRDAGLEGLCRAVQGDFTALTHPDDHFDAAYSFEAICHVEERSVVLRELARVVKPGGLIAGTDWCTTAAFRPGDPDHQRICTDIVEGNGLAPMMSMDANRAAFAEAGLELVESQDLAPCGPHDVPWYQPLQAGWRTPTELRRTTLGRGLTGAMVRALEATRFAPKGTVATSDMLNRAADSLIEGGALGIFTPLFFFVARVPE